MKIAQSEKTLRNIKKVNYNDEIISTSSTTIAVRKKKLHLPKYRSIHSKEEKRENALFAWSR